MALLLAGAFSTGVTAQASVRVEAGLGVGAVGEGGGLNGRLAAGFLLGRWGGLVRVTMHDGGTGTPEPGLFSGMFGPPVELFEDAGILFTRSLVSHPPHRVLLSLGIGTIWGRRIDPEDGVGMVDLDRTWGIPLELALYFGDGRGVGFGILVAANLNREVPQFGIMTSLNLGF